MPQPIVHIGFNKCGSTAIQTWLAGNIAALAEQGVAYRRSDPRDDVVCTNPQVAVLAYTLSNRTVWPREMNTVLGITQGDRASQDAVAYAFAHGFAAWAESLNADKIVLSNESLATRLNTPATIRALDDWLTDTIGPARYIVYVREPMAWMVSLHGHAVRRGTHRQSLEQLAKRRSTAPFAEALTLWRQVVGPDRLDVRLFDESWLKGAGLIEDFAAAVGVDASRTQRETRLKNTSFRGARWYSRLRFSSRTPQRPRPDSALQQRIREANAPGMAWIEQTFFHGREQQFRAWLTPDIQNTK